MAQRIALVTGANKGIGYFIVDGLAAAGLKKVYLGSRDIARGQEAVDKLQAAGRKNVELLQIDLEDASTISKALAHIKETDGRLDILVNNAGFAYKVSATEPMSKQAEDTMRINFTGTKCVIDTFLPFMESQDAAADGFVPRIVNVSSRAGLLNKYSDSLREQLLSDDLTPDALVKLLQSFVDAAKEGKHTEQGWPDSAYGPSKAGVSMLSRISARLHPKVLQYAMCPGWCKTDMAGYEKPPRTAEEGADTAIWLALAEPPIPTGKFYAERAELSWV